MERGDERGNNLGKLTQMLSEWPCSAYYVKDKHKIVTTDATTTELEKTMWQEQPDGNTKPMA